MCAKVQTTLCIDILKNVGILGIKEQKYSIRFMKGGKMDIQELSILRYKLDI